MLKNEIYFLSFAEGIRAELCEEREALDSLLEYGQSLGISKASWRDMKGENSSK